VPKAWRDLRKSSKKALKLFSSFLRGASCPKSPRFECDGLNGLLSQLDLLSDRWEGMSRERSGGGMCVLGGRGRIELHAVDLVWVKFCAGGRSTARADAFALRNSEQAGANAKEKASARCGRDDTFTGICSSLWCGEVVESKSRDLGSDRGYRWLSCCGWGFI
jgi:hypothetical protein